MIQRTAARWVLARHERRASVTDMLAELKWRSLKQRWADIALTMLYKIRNTHVQITPSHLIPVTGIAASAHPHHYVQYHTDTSTAAQLLLPPSCEDVERLTCWCRHGPIHWRFQESGGPGVPPYLLDQPPNHPDTHPAWENSLSGWMTGWGGYWGGGGLAHLRSISPTN